MSHHCYGCEGNYNGEDMFDLANNSGSMCRHCIQTHVMLCENLLANAYRIIEFTAPDIDDGLLERIAGLIGVKNETT